MGLVEGGGEERALEGEEGEGEGGLWCGHGLFLVV